MRKIAIDEKRTSQYQSANRRKTARKIARETKYETFSICTTSTGWFCRCCRCVNKSDVAGELGVGVSVYFKQLKNLVVILLICTILSMPAYVLFYSGHSLNNPDLKQDSSFDLNTSLAAISLANLGQ